MHLLAFPSKCLRKQPKRESLEAIFDLDKIPRTDGFLENHSAICILNICIGMYVRGAYPWAKARSEPCICVPEHFGIQRRALIHRVEVPDKDLDQSLERLGGRS